MSPQLRTVVLQAIGRANLIWSPPCSTVEKRRRRRAVIKIMVVVI
jgi:hypothetical protein